MKTITITNELYEELKDKIEAKKTVTIYKRDGSVLFESTKETLHEAVLEKYASDANLRDANLIGANLRDANLRDANLIGANLRDANLIDANLIGANLRGADLYGANLRGADLYGADLYGANLRDAELQNVKFYGRGGTQKLTKEQVLVFLVALGFIVEE